MTTTPKECYCKCGYRCGGPGKCKEKPFDCLEIADGKHFVVDCGHDFTGPWIEFENNTGGSVTCVKCGLSSMAHAVGAGP